MVNVATPPANMEYTYEAAYGSRIRNEDAPIVGTWLEELDGRDAQGIVEEAAKPDAPPVVHNYFEWDNSIAGAIYRREQASRLARAVQVKVITRDSDGNESELTGPAFYAVREPVDEETQEEHDESRAPSRKAYISFRVVERNENYKEQVIETAKRELIGRRHKYAASLKMFAQEAPRLAAAFDAIAHLAEEEDE